MLWKVIAAGDHIAFGGKRRRKLHPDACNEPFKDFYWCPRRKWFSKKPCPFLNRLECDNFKAMCGAL